MPRSLASVALVSLALLALLALLEVLASGAGAADAFTPDADGFRAVALPYFQKHCVSCHGAEKEKGDLNVEAHLQNNFLDLAEAGKWGEILDVVNSHEMPPEDEPQPDPDEAAAFAAWVGGELARAEISQKATRVVLRRLNRAEYANTIRDLVGVPFDPEAFPEDASADGFDNVGSAMTISPIQLEQYYDAARQIIDDAIVTGEQPPAMKWRFEPEEDTRGGDRTRVERDGQRVLLNAGENRKEDGFTVSRLDSWNKKINFRDFRVEHPGTYTIRIRAATRVPSRDEVVESVRPFLLERAQEDAKKREREYDPGRVEEELEHFRTEPMYDYGPARASVSVELGGQPKDIATFDIDARYPEPDVYEIPAFFDTQKAGVTLAYAYSIPSVLENFWCQGKEEFARPEMYIDWIELEGPVYSQWPPAPHTQLFDGLPDGGTWGADEARTVVARFMREAWRRPVTDDEVARKLALFDPEGDFFEAIKAPLVATLVSPKFLYLAEPAADPRPLDDHEIASRLSYFLWSSMPDAELVALAGQGALTDPNMLAKQVDRLLADPKNAAFSENFAGQWLDLRKIGANPPAPDLYPKYDRHLETSIAAESVGFFREILEGDLSVLNFVRSDFVTINERLARFYGIGGVRGDAIRKVSVPPDARRGGIVTQASVLSTTSNGTRTSPVVRGTWILKNLLGTDPGLPVANAGEIAPKVPGIDKATVRQRLEIHRELPQCARCHDKIDPLGFALENFNAAGDWRDKEGFGYKGRIGDNDPDIDASAKMPDGSEFVGVGGLQDELLKNEDLFLRCLSEKLFTYALGRELGYSDAPHVRAAVAHLKSQGYTLRSLIHAIVTSEPFLTK
ncbi:hypothetical protein BH23VER1_BH23VER1_19720 [soil metagenome]